MSLYFRFVGRPFPREVETKSRARYNSFTERLPPTFFIDWHFPKLAEQNYFRYVLLASSHAVSEEDWRRLHLCFVNVCATWFIVVGNISGFGLKGSSFHKLYEHWERRFVFPKAYHWWWYLFGGYEANLMNLRLIEGRSVVDVFTLYAYIHASLQITLLHVFPSKYNGKEISCEESRVWVVDKRVFKLSSFLVWTNE